MMPDFMVIGAPRAATTSVYHYLRQHPEIAMSSLKETNFFAYLASQTGTPPILPVEPWPVKSLAEYHAKFQRVQGQKAVGEVSPSYLYTPGVPEKIEKHLPDIRLIAILRNPVERAYSSHVKNVREGYESRSFDQAVEDEMQRPETTVHSTTYYARAGLYFSQLTRYLASFHRSQIGIYLYEDLAESPCAFMQAIFVQLGVNSAFVPDTSVRFDRGYVPLIKSSPRGRRLKQLTGSLRQKLPRNPYFAVLRFQDGILKNLMQAPEIPRHLRMRLRDFYAEDIGNLQKLIGRDLTRWLEQE